MKAKSVLPWIFVLASATAAFSFWNANQKAQAELTQLRADHAELSKLREQAEEMTRLASLEPEVERLRKETAEVHKLRNEVRQLKEEGKQLNAQIQDLQTRQTGSADNLAAELQQLRAENELLKTSGTPKADTVPIEQTLEEYKNVCIANLRQLDGATEQWALENKKTSGDIPEYEALLTYLASPPACPQGGSYTIAGVGKKPSCNMTNHQLP